MGHTTLNRIKDGVGFAYYYAVPVFDMGLVIEPARDGTGIAHLVGRVTVLYPGTTCLVCRDVTDPEEAREELMKRQYPGKYARLKAEGYVRGAGNPRPAVVTFTTGTAVIAVNECLDRLTGYRNEPRDHRIHDFLDESDLVLAPSSNPNCKFCGTQQHAGNGDARTFLERGK